MNKTKIIMSILIFCVLISSAFAYNQAHIKSCKEEYFDCIIDNNEGRCFQDYCVEEDYLQAYKNIYSGQDGINGESGSSGSSGFSKLLKYLENEFFNNLNNYFVRISEYRNDNMYIYNKLNYLDKQLNELKISCEN